MPELTTLAILVGLFLSAIAGEAVIYRDTLSLQINVPAALQEKGFNEPVAEEVFSSEAARIIRGDSVIPAPTMRIHSQPNLLSAIVQPLSLDTAVAALQTQFGVDRLAVVAAIMPGRGKPDRDEGPTPASPAGSDAQPLQIVLVVSQPEADPVQARLAQEDGDPVALVPPRGAMDDGTGRPLSRRAVAFPQRHRRQCRRVRADPADRRPRPGPPMEIRARPRERALLYNILGLVDPAENDLAGARAAYRAAGADSRGAAGGAGGGGAQPGRPRAGRQAAGAGGGVAEAGEGDRHRRRCPAFAINRRLVEGLVAWGSGDLAAAEAHFRSVAAQAPLNEAGHRYLGQVLAARGDRDGAASALDAALAVHSADPPQQALAVALFWVDPVDGGLTRRF